MESFDADCAGVLGLHAEARRRLGAGARAPEDLPELLHGVLRRSLLAELTSGSLKPGCGKGICVTEDSRGGVCRLKLPGVCSPCLRVSTYSKHRRKGQPMKDAFVSKRIRRLAAS